MSGSGNGTLPQNQSSKVDESGAMQKVTFTVPSKLSKNAKIYVCASEQGHANWTVPSAESNRALSLTVKPAPMASSFQKLLLLLGGLFALISLGVFVLTMPRRAAVPQPVGRRQ